MSEKITPRSALVTTGRVAVAVLAGARIGDSAAADQSADVELLRLWGKLIAQMKITKDMPHRAEEDAFDAAHPMPSLPYIEQEATAWANARWAFCNTEEHRTHYDEWSDSISKENRIREAIVATRATTLAGIAIKLAAAHGTEFLEDHEEAAGSVLKDIARLTGTDFVAIKAEAEA